MISAKFPTSKDVTPALTVAKSLAFFISLIVCASFSTSYPFASSDPFPFEGDPLGFLFRYPLQLLLATLSQWFSGSGLVAYRVM